MSHSKLFTSAILIAIMLGTAVQSHAQFGRDKTKPDASPAAVSAQTIGVNSTISITYHRPAVKGREIWGTGLAPYAPKLWRAGANETTTLTFSDDVTVNGKDVPAGTYGVHFELSEDTWTIIINKDYKTWGSFQYKADNDVARVETKVEDASHQERLLFSFDNLTADGADLSMHWGEKKASVTVALKK
jgi:hypothetical protein